MEKITIRVKNWKCYETRHLAFEAYAILIQPNGSGKTAILDAIEFALTGDVQSARERSAGLRGKDHLASFIRGGQKEAIVRLELGDRAFIERKLSLSGGKVTESIACHPDGGETSNTNRERAFLDAVKPHLPLLKMRDFVKLRVADRRKFIEGMMPQPSDTEVKGMLMREIPEDRKSIMDEWYSGMTFSQASERMLTKLGEGVSNARKERLGYQKHDALIVDFPTVTGTPVELDAEIKKQEKLLDELQTRIGASSEKSAMLDRAQNALAALADTEEEIIAKPNVRAESEIGADIAKYRKDMTDYTAKQHACQDAAQTFKETKHQVEVYKSGSCPQCGQSVTHILGNAEAVLANAEAAYKAAADAVPECPEAKLKQTEQELRDAGRATHDYTAKVMSVDTRKATQRARRLELENQINQLGQLEPVDEITERAQVLGDKLAELRANRRLFDEEKASRDLAARAKAKIAEYADIEASFEAARSAIAKVRTHVLTSAIKGVNERIGDVMLALTGQAMNLSVQLVDERGADKCDIRIGFARESVDFESISDSQQYFMLAALAIASGLDHAGLRLALFDSTEVFDGENIKQFTAAIDKMAREGIVNGAVLSFAGSGVTK